MNLIIDSGAFSAWKLGKPIDVDEYCDFLLANLEWIPIYVALDVINPNDPEEAAAASHKNFLHMRKRGLNPLPVWHVKENVSWLHRMLDAGCDYIGISASSLVSRNAVDTWYASAWDNLVNSDGLPIIKAHAFGEGRYSSLLKFPFYSADTTSWIYSAQRAADIRLDDKRKVNVKKTLLSMSNNRHIDDLPAFDSEEFTDILRRAGVSIDSLRNADIKTSYTLTTFLTMMYYLDIQKRISAKCPIAFKRPGFVKTYVNAPAVHIPDFNLHFVLGGNISATAVAIWFKAQNTLMSYFYLRGDTPAGTKMLQMVRDVVLDPMAALERWPRLGAYYKILEQHVSKELVS